MDYTYDTNGVTREKLRMVLKDIRMNPTKESTCSEDMFRKVIGVEPRFGYLDGRYVKRLVVFLSGTGCSLATETGGCTFCGFYNATNFGRKVSDENYLEQIQGVIQSEKYDFKEFPIICLYNDGSLLREEEISFQAFQAILKILDQEKSVEKIVIEARVEDITEEKLQRMKQATSKQLEIAVGYESANPMIRDLCINKSFTQEVFERNAKVAKTLGISIVPLLMVKPPFLTEYEAVADYVESLKYLDQFGLKRIDMELPTVEENTLLHRLWLKDQYAPLWFWSMIEILRQRDRAGLKTPLYISPQNYSVSAKAKTSNCPICDEQIHKAIERFNMDGDVKAFDAISCECQKEWQALYTENKEWSGDIPARVENTVNQLISEMIYMNKKG